MVGRPLRRFWLWCALAVLLTGGNVAFAALSVAYSTISTGQVVNLTQQGTLDWVHWGLFTESSVDRKGGVPPQISNFELVFNESGWAFAYQYADNWNGYSWSDGTPTMSATDTHSGVWAYGTPQVGSGFKFTAPATTNTQTLKVYVGAYAGRGQFVAVLSDGSGSYTNPVNATVNNISSGPSSVYSINYSSATNNQTLTVYYTLDRIFQPDGNVTLQAATLSAPGANNLPFVTLTSPAEGTSVAAPVDLNLAATASDADGFVARVEFFAGTNLIGESVTAPYSVVWTNAPPGAHTLTARVIDDSGGAGVSTPVQVFVNGSGGALAVTRAAAPEAVNLTSEGVSDWAHWGLESSLSYNHKALGGTQIPNFKQIGTNAVTRYTDNRTAFSWSDGSPVVVTNGSTTGVYITGVRNGFEINAPADTTTRTLRVYVSLYGAQGNFQAWLSDFSGTAYSDTSLSNNFGNSYVVYTLVYSAASAGQRLIVRHRVQSLFDTAYGNVTLQAATLQGPPPVLPVMLKNPHRTPGAFVFSFDSAPDRTYAAQYSAQVWPADWQTFSTLPGNGSTIWMTNSDAGGVGFYRVITQ